MAKRFIDSNLFNDSWFMNLNPDSKLLYIYFITTCDIAGIIDYNIKLAEFMTGCKNIDKSFDNLKSRLTYIKDNYYFLNKFILYQYGSLNDNCAPHRAVIKKLDLFNINYSEFVNNGFIGKTHSITKKNRSIVINRDGKKCIYCEKEVNNFELCLDHVVARSLGGTDEINNIVVSCRLCNSKKGNLPLDGFIKENNLSKDVLERVTETLSVSDKDKDKDKDTDKDIDTIIYIVDYLNQKTDKKFKTTTAKTRELIIARINDGFILDDFKRVIDNKVIDWLNEPNWNKFLRPETLFSNKFESYLNQNTKVEENVEFTLADKEV